MEKWEFRPLISIGKIEFGMERNQVHKLFAEACKEFKKSKYSKNTTDDYGKFHVFYTVDNKVEAVEIFDDIEVVVEGAVVFPVTLEKAKAVLGNMTEDTGSYIQTEKSVGIYAPEKKVESILVGNKGYYSI
jgi:hypothetical protein